jgi:hypothetical protein
MVYNTRNYWVSGPCSSAEILNSRKHNVSEIGIVCALMVGGGRHSFGSLRN